MLETPVLPRVLKRKIQETPPHQGWDNTPKTLQPPTILGWGVYGGHYYLQISNWGASREASGWRAQIWHTSQAGPCKSPPQPGTPHFIHPRPAGGKGEAASREDKHPNGPTAAPSVGCRL